MSITVVIPTKDRSDDYLYTTLESVKQQTALNQIDKIIVSENGVTDSSKLVCESFPELNITYIKQPQQLSFVEHMHWLMVQPTTTYTAMLHDDDWWYPTHLETALKAFEDGSIACYFSNYIYAFNEILKYGSLHYTTFISYIKDKFSALDPIEFSLSETLVLCYLYTPFHMSSMVCKTDVMKKVSEHTSGISHAFYADRILYPYMALYGKLVMQPQILCGIRLHKTNLSNEIEDIEKRKSHIDGSRLIMELAKTQNVDVLEEWKRIKIKIGSEQWNNVQSAYNYYFGKSGENSSCFYIDEPSLKNRVKNRIRKLVK